MEKALFREKVDSLMPDLVEYIRKQSDRLYSCGGIDTSKYEDDFRLPKLIISVVLKDAILQFSPMSVQDIKNARNLEHF